MPDGITHNPLARALVNSQAFRDYLQPKLRSLHQQALLSLVQGELTLGHSAPQTVSAAAAVREIFRLLSEIYRDAGVPVSMETRLVVEPARPV